MAPQCDPFQLFPNQIQSATLWKYTAPGLDNIKLADVKVIIKHSTESDQPTEYGTRIATRRFHIQPATIPDNLCEDMEAWPDLILKLNNGHTYQITKASRGDDMDTGQTTFITLTGNPYGRTSL
nr:MAG: hypothetical protein [Bacteriophage sp.]